MKLMTIPTTMTVPRRGADIGSSLGRRRAQKGACATARPLWQIGPVLALSGCGPLRSISFHATTSRRHRAMKRRAVEEGITTIEMGLHKPLKEQYGTG